MKQINNTTDIAREVTSLSQGIIQIQPRSITYVPDDVYDPGLSLKFIEDINVVIVD